MPYTPTVWLDRQTKLGPTNLNKIEQGIAAAAGAADGALPATQKGAANGVASLDASAKVPYASLAAQPKAHIYLSANVTIATATWTTPSGLTLVAYDTASFYTSSGKFTIPQSGVYLVLAHASWGVFAATQHVLRVLVNGSETWRNTSAGAPAVDVVQSLPASGSFGVGTTLEMQVYQDSGSNQTLSNSQTYFMITKLA